MKKCGDARIVRAQSPRVGKHRGSVCMKRLTLLSPGPRVGAKLTREGVQVTQRYVEADLGGRFNGSDIIVPPVDFAATVAKFSKGSGSEIKVSPALSSPAVETVAGAAFDAMAKVARDHEAEGKPAPTLASLWDEQSEARRAIVDWGGVRLSNIRKLNGRENVVVIADLSVVASIALHVARSRKDLLSGLWQRPYADVVTAILASFDEDGEVTGLRVKGLPPPAINRHGAAERGYYRGM